MATAGAVIVFPAMIRALVTSALAAGLLAPATALAAPVEALPPPKPPAIEEVAPGVAYQRIVQGDGQVVHVVRAPRSPRVSIAPVLAGGSPAARGPLTGAVAARLGTGVVAGINGDFFSPGTNDPSGVVLIGGELIHEPEASRSALVMLPGGGIDALELALQGRMQAVDPTGVVTYPVRSFAGMNRPAKRGSETLLYTPAFGAAATPTSGSRYEVRVRLDQAGPLLPNQPRTGTVIATGSGGGMTIGAGHWVLTGVGSAGMPLVSEYPLGQAVTISPGLLSLPAGALDAVGGGPALVRAGTPITSAGEGFTSSQTGARTSRSAVGQTADGTTLLVTVEGPSQGRAGMTVAEQAGLMASLGATTAIAMDAGGSAQLAVRDDLVIPWSGPRSLSDVVLMSYRGVTIEPLPFRLSPNADRVDDAAATVVRAPAAGVATVTVARRSGRPTKRLWQGRLGPGSAKISLDPRRLGLPDGVYVVVARHVPDDGSGETEQRRRVIVDRTLSSLNARAATVRVGRKPQPRLGITFRLLKPARVTVRIRTREGAPLTTLASGRPMRAGRRSVTWNRKVRKSVISGTVQVTVEARSAFGTSGLVREVTLRTPPRPRPPRAAP
jgi:hypothetical protein